MASSTERRTLWVGVAILFLLGTAAFIFLESNRPKFHGVVLTPAQPAEDFQLTDDDGRQFLLSDQRGRIVLVYFGYTNCPDECPITMAKLRQTLDILEEQSSDVTVTLITTDPARDGPAELKQYLSHFHPDFIGLYGTPAELQAVYTGYGVVVMDDGETHTARTYVIDPAGDLVMTFPYELGADEMASDLRLLLRRR